MKPAKSNLKGIVFTGISDGNTGFKGVIKRVSARVRACAPRRSFRRDALLMRETFETRIFFKSATSEFPFPASPEKNRDRTQR